jgi:hypothetical protein
MQNFCKIQLIFKIKESVIYKKKETRKYIILMDQDHYKKLEN